MSKAKFSDGLSGGLPENTAISHKFGEALPHDSNGKTVHELHDCGIIYATEHPYLLCVMTKGEDFKDLSEDLKSISQLVFQEVTRNYR